MSHIIEKVGISRVSCNGVWQTILLCVNADSLSFSPIYGAFNRPDDHRDEIEVISELIDETAEIFDLISSHSIKSQVLQSYNQLRESIYWGGINRQSIEVILVPKEPETHQSCMKNNDNEATIQTSEENEISQSDIKQKLAIVNKDSNVMKFFEENRCSVCLSSYKEIFDNDLHIVIPSCGHPLCCGCADNILVSTKKECPRCRGNITAASFNLMKFNADLEIDVQDQIVFL